MQQNTLPSTATALKHTRARAHARKSFALIDEHMHAYTHTYTHVHMHTRPAPPIQQRSREVYSLLDEEMSNPIHALSITVSGTPFKHKRVNARMQGLLVSLLFFILL